MITAARQSTESGAHWRYPDGRPCFETMGAKGQMVKTTLFHAKKLGLVPSVTMICKAAAEPELEAWKREQAILAAITTQADTGEAPDHFAKRIAEESGREASLAADLGSAIHASLAAALTGNAYDPEHEGYVAPILFYFAGQKVQAVEEVVCGKGYCGSVDLRMSCATIPDYNDIFDFKTCRRIPDKPYRSHRLQLSAYAAALEESKKCTVHNCYNVYIDVNRPGIFTVHTIGNWLRVFHQGFVPLHEYWVWHNYEQTIKV